MKFRRISSRLLPVLFLATLLLAFPLYDTMYDEAVFLLRLHTGRFLMSAGSKNQAEGVLLGIYRPEFPYSFEGLPRLEQAIEKQIDIISFYSTWGDRKEDAFPIELMREIDKTGAIPLLTWEPWTSEFEANTGRKTDAMRSDLRGIIAGRYDTYIHEWAREAVTYGKPFFLRFAHEMNNPAYPWSLQSGNTTAEIVLTWRHVWQVFHNEGAKNVIWVWSPFQEAMPELYPGKEYVDWIGTGALNYGTRAGVWYSFEHLFENVYRSVILFEKPIMIAELACAATGGSRPAWYSEAWHKLLTQYPAVQAVVLYNNPRDRTHPDFEIDWSIDDDDESLSTVADAVRNGLFRK